MKLKNAVFAAALAVAVVPSFAAAPQDVCRIEQGPCAVSFTTSTRQLEFFRDGKRFAIGTFPGVTNVVKVESVRNDAGTGTRMSITTGAGAYFIGIGGCPGFIEVTGEAVRPESAARELNRVPVLDLTVDFGVGADGLAVQGTGFLSKPAEKQGSYVTMTMADPKTRRGVVTGWLTHDRGDGVMFADVAAGKGVIHARCDYGHYPVGGGRGGHLETLLVGFFDDARLGLEAYGDAVAKVEKIRLPDPWVGYCTWYSHPNGGAASEKALKELVPNIATNLVPFGYGFVQIDDKWQVGATRNGPQKQFDKINPHGPYPQGFKATVDVITNAGMVAGLWMLPFGGSSDDPAFPANWFARRKADGKPYDTAWGGTTLDMSEPGARKFVADNIRRATYDWGFGYLKLDGLSTGLGVQPRYVTHAYKEDGFGDCVFHDPTKSNVEIYRDGCRLIRESMKPGTVLLGCCCPQNNRSLGSSFGFFDAMRVGEDNYNHAWRENDAILSGPRTAGNLFFLNGRVWWNDPDPVYVSNGMPIDWVRVMASWVAIARTWNSSSDWFPSIATDRIDILRRTMPPHRGVTRPVDYFEARIPQAWLATDSSTGTRRDVLGLFNFDLQQKPQSFSLDAAWIGLPPAEKYVAFEYWTDALLPVFGKTFAADLPPACCRMFAIRPLADHPQLISTSRHVMQGMVDVVSEKWDPATLTLSGVSRLVGGDPYELRVVTLASGAPFTVKSAAVSTAGVACGSCRSEEGLVRITLTSRRSCEAAWSVTFVRGGASAAVKPVVTAFTAAQAHAFAPVSLAWTANVKSVRILRDGKVLAARALGGAYEDAEVEPDHAYSYAVEPLSLAGLVGPAVDAAIRTRPLPALGAVPPPPEVPLSSLKPLSVKVGAGRLVKDRSATGPLTLGTAVYTNGVYAHADAELAYARDPAWKRFVAVVGIDEAMRKEGSLPGQVPAGVMFRVIGKTKDAPVILASSPVIRFGGQEKWYFDVAIPADAIQVVLVVDGLGNIRCDHSEWCDAGFRR